MANTNYERILEDLVALAEGFPPPDGDDEYESPWVEDFRAGHWAVGWVEHVIVRADSPEPILQAAVEIYCALQDYPVYDESAYSDACYEAITGEWEDGRVQDRIEHCKEAEISIFAARRDEIPTEVYDMLSNKQGYY